MSTLTVTLPLTLSRHRPRRLTPGYEKRLSSASLALVYVMFGLGLLIGGRLINASANDRP